MPASLRAILVLCLAVPLTAPAAVNEVTVVEVSDADVLVIRDEAGNRYDVRLAGVDAPELDQPFGERAREWLSELTLGEQARLEWDKVDRDGRAVGRLWVVSPDMPCRGEPTCPKNLDVGHALIAMGLAWHFKRYQAEQGEEDRASYDFDENEARVRKTGLWSEPDPVPPWEWREGKRTR